MNKNECLIIVGEGGIPSDFPKSELFKFLTFKSKIDCFLDLNNEERREFEELKYKLENWRRNFRNDEYYHTLFDLANFIELKYCIKTYYAFLEFSKPDLIQSIELAIKENFKKIYIISTKLILKKEDELKIKDIIQLIKMKYKNFEIINLTNLNFNEISNFLMNIVEKEGKT